MFEAVRALGISCLLARHVFMLSNEARVSPEEKLSLRVRHGCGISASAAGAFSSSANLTFKPTQDVEGIDVNRVICCLVAQEKTACFKPFKENSLLAYFTSDLFPYWMHLHCNYLCCGKR